MLEFTKALYELFVVEGLSLSNSLMVMKAKPKADSVSKAAASIYSLLESGSLFSNALRSCRVVIFDDVYISFVSIAEKNGDLKSALLYLKQKLEREAECRKKIAGALVYPFFVVLISIIASLYVGLYTDSPDLLLLVKYVLCLILICAMLFILIMKMLGNSSLFESFTAVDFLLRSGIELSEAVACAVQIAGPSSKIGKLFENARMKLSYGMDLQSAFCGMSGGSLASKIKEAFYFADAGGSKDDLFEKVAAYLSAEKERSRAICLSLIEPLFIVITGGFILVLLMTFFMPVITDIGLI